MTKIGTAMTSSVPTSDRLSTNLPLRTAAQMPMPMPNTNSMAKAVSAKVSVTGQRWAKMSETGVPLNVRPKSPVRMPFM